MKSLEIEVPRPLPAVQPALQTSPVFIFFFNGAASLLGWFSLLNSLDYYAGVYSRYDVYAFFTVPFFIGNIICVFLFKILTNRFSYMKLIYIGLVGVNVCLIILFMSSVFFMNIQGLGFGVSIIVCVLLGFLGNLPQLSYFAMINYMSKECITKYTIGTAASGLFLTICRMIIVAIAGAHAKSRVPIILYNAIAISINLFDLTLMIRFCRSQTYKRLIQPYLKGTALKEQLTQNNQKKDEILIALEQSFEKLTYIQKMKNTFHVIHPYPLIVMFNFIITLSLFPDLALRKTFSFDFVWSSLIFVFLYGLGDTIGKFLVQIPNSFNEKSNLYLFFSRIFFFWSICVLASKSAEDDPLMNNYVFPFLNILIFAISNGFVLSTSFLMAFKICPVKNKQYAGVLCGIMAQFGLVFGTILAIPLSKIVVH